MKKIEFEIEIPDFGFGKNKKRVGKTGGGKTGKWRSVRDNYGFLLVPVISWGIPLALMGVFDLTFSGILILGYFLFALIWGLDSRLSAGLALFFLVLCPAFLQFGKDILAQDFAVFAFYFLCITVIQEIREMILEHFRKIIPTRHVGRVVKKEVV